MENEDDIIHFEEFEEFEEHEEHEEHEELEELQELLEYEEVDEHGNQPPTDLLSEFSCRYCSLFGFDYLDDLCLNCFFDANPETTFAEIEERFLTSLYDPVAFDSKHFVPPPTPTQMPDLQQCDSLSLPEVPNATVIEFVMDVMTKLKETLDLERAKEEAEKAEAKEKKKKKRCAVCKEKVGLLGFHCRCGLLLCSTHRYPEEHVCSFDYKKAGKEKLMKENPVVAGSKMDSQV